MSILKIYLYGSPILRKKIATVGTLPDKFSNIIDDMFATMYEEDGIGLSANQVGQDMSFFIADFSQCDENRGKEVIINPLIINSQGETSMEEGCLSIPGIREKVPRSERIILQYETISGKQKKEEFSGLMARIAQHEMDHLNGLFFVDRISSIRRSFLSSKLKKIATIAVKKYPDELRL